MGARRGKKVEETQNLAVLLRGGADECAKEIGASMNGEGKVVGVEC